MPKFYLVALFAYLAGVLTVVILVIVANLYGRMPPFKQKHPDREVYSDGGF